MNKKIYFCGSIRGGYQDAELYQRVIQYMKKTDIVLTEHIGSKNIHKIEEHQTDKDIYIQDTTWLKESDIVIAECTTASLGVGYELATAERLGKPTYIFYDKTRTHLSAMLTGDDYYSIIPYEKEEDIYPELDKFLQ